jgi:hypothetical protein
MPLPLSFTRSHPSCLWRSNVSARAAARQVRRTCSEPLGAAATLAARYSMSPMPRVATVFHADRRRSPQRDPEECRRAVRGLVSGCGYTPRRRSGLAAVPWHIRPLHRPHAGSDSLPNLLCVCPTHAQELDAGAVRVGADGVVSVAPWRLRLEHQLDPEALHYRWERYWAAVT